MLAEAVGQPMYAPAPRVGGKAPAPAPPALERPDGMKVRQCKRGESDDGFGNAGPSRVGNAARVKAAWQWLEEGGNLGEFILPLEGQGARDMSTWLLGKHATHYTAGEDPTTASTLLRLALPSISSLLTSRHSEIS